MRLSEKNLILQSEVILMKKKEKYKEWMGLMEKSYKKIIFYKRVKESRTKFTSTQNRCG